MVEIDLRLLEIEIQVGDNIHRFTGDLAIRAQGMLFANPLSDVGEVTIFNLDRATQDYILQVTSPYTSNRQEKFLNILAGRKSYGTTLIYRGTILVANATQPPDIGVVLKCLSGATFQNTIYSVSYPGSVSAVTAYGALAKRFNASTHIQITNLPNIGNYAFSGTAIGELKYINSFGTSTSFVTHGRNGNTLVVKGIYTPLTGTLRVVSEETGMIGVPEWTELGVRVTFLIDNKTQIGGGLQIISRRYPAFSGYYVIFKLGYNLASREEPFYYIAEAARVAAPGEGIFNSGSAQ